MLLLAQALGNVLVTPCWKSSAGQSVAISLQSGASPIWLSANPDHNVNLASEVGADQRWIIIDHGTHFVIQLDTADALRDRIYLSTTPDGSNVDLWRAVGGDQRWLILDFGDRMWPRDSKEGSPTLPPR